MTSSAPTVTEYLESLPEDRRQAITKVRAAMKKKLPKGYDETMQYGMISYVVPHKLYPAGYHCNPKEAVPFAALASQKNYISIYLMAVYAVPELQKWLLEACAKAGIKLDMGKSCLRFKKLEDIPLEIIGELLAKVPVEEFLKIYESKIKPPKK